MSGNPPIVTLASDKTSYQAGDRFTVTVTVTDPDTATEVIHGTDGLGRTVVQTSAFLDAALVSAARFPATGMLANVSGLTLTGSVQAGAGDLEVTVRDGQGNETTSTIPIPVRSSMLIGSDRSPIDMGVYPALAYTRIYGPNGMPSLAKIPTQVKLPHLSYKGATNAVAVKSLLDKLVRPIILESLHEPDRAVANGGPTASAFRADAAVLRDTVRAHPNGHLVKLVRTFMRWSQAHNRPARQWEDFWDDYVDVIGFDCEWDASFKDLLPSGYPDPEAFFAIPVNAAKKVGKPLAIPELGWPQIATDKDGSGLAAWYVASAKYLDSVGCYAVAAYDSTGQTSPTGTYVLSGRPLAAWQSVTATQR